MKNKGFVWFWLGKDMMKVKEIYMKGVLGFPCLARLARPKMRQHQNHFGALGSSPPGPGEGSLQ